MQIRSEIKIVALTYLSSCERDFYKVVQLQKPCRVGQLYVFFCKLLVACLCQNHLTYDFCGERQTSLLDTSVYELDVIPGRYCHSVAVIVEVSF